MSETRPLEVDDIPPSCPVYDVRYVYIYDVTPTYVYCGYLPGYFGCYPYYGTVVYGTGHRYRPWRGRRHYYPRPCTWGLNPRYNPWLGRWSFGYSYGSGFLRTGYRWQRGLLAQHPHSPPRWFGPGGYRRPLLGPDRAMLRVRAARPLRPLDPTPLNLYLRQRNAPRVDQAASRLPLRPIVRSKVRVDEPNNVFAGKDGKVYQRDDRGIWRVNHGRDWKPTQLPRLGPAKPTPPGGVGLGSRRGRDWPRERPRQPESRPLPARPSEPRDEPRPVSRALPQRPVPPTISPVPGNLEREFHGRQRGNAAPEPAKPSPSPDQEKEGAKREKGLHKP